MKLYLYLVILVRVPQNSNTMVIIPERRPRPRVTTPAQDDAILQAVHDYPFTNAVSIREQLHLDVTPQTVRRRLREAGIRHRIPARKERLTEQHRAARLAFARQYVDRGVDFFSRFVFTDEKTFNSTNHGLVHNWRPHNTR